MKSTYCHSSDGQTELHLVYWEPEKQPKGVVQLIHGMAEYIERYTDFADYLTDAGYLVVGHDHLGHGKSVNQENPQHGYFGKGDTAQHVIDDIEIVRARVTEQYPEIPYFMLGHSMGSFALRCYLQKYHTPISGVVLMGSGTGATIIPTALSITAGLNRLQPKKVNHLLDQLAFGSFSKKFPEAGQFNWLSKNQENIRRYEEDELTGFTFTNNGFHTLFQLIHGANKKGWTAEISKELPILLISGEKDSVGDYGKGIRKIAKTLDASGTTDLSMVLFADLRHELLFEDEKQQVYEKIGDWFDKHL